MTERFTDKDNARENGLALVFDLDGVLVNSEVHNFYFYVEVFLRAAAELNIPDINPLSIEKIAESYPLGLKDAIANLTPPEYKSFVPQIIEIARATPRYPDLLVYPHNLEGTLTDLRGKCPLGIVTNATERSVSELFDAHPQIAPLFDVVISDAEKPDPTQLLAALDELAVHPENAALVGDAINTDGEAARRAGIHFIYVAPKKESAPNAILVVRDINELSLSFESLSKAISSQRMT